MDIIAVDTRAVSQLWAWHSVVTAAQAHDHPDEPPQTLEQTARRLTMPPLNSRLRLWTAAVDGVTVGVGYLRLPIEQGDGRPAEIDVLVHPAYRRQGIGARLLGTAADAVRAHGQPTVVAQAISDTPAVPFLEGQGFRCVLVLAGLLLRVDDVDPDWLAGTLAAGPPGYRLVRWTGMVPDELADAFATAKLAMGDMPMEEPTGDQVPAGQVRWDADRVREMAEVVAKRGDDLYTVAALRGRAVAGFTEVVVPAGAAERAAQYDTAVVPEHRGRRIGIWVKAAMLEWLRAERPEVREIETDNADDNVHMLAVNEELGFRRLREYRDYQADAADLPRLRG
jgi:GNAT superfamily N-acetyltransferase